METNPAFDALGNRMKEYESVPKNFLMRKTPVVMRIDGKAFHTFTKKMNFQKPFDEFFIRLMNETAVELCKQIQGAKCAFVQSDEISILITDFDTIKTDAWFGYNIQKMTSIAASIATQHFNKMMSDNVLLGNLGELVDLSITVNNTEKPVSTEEAIVNYLQSKIDKYKALPIAQFDARCFNLPTKEVSNYFMWRQQDCVRNSIQSVAQSLYTQKELHGSNTKDLQELIHAKGINWNNYEAGKKRGRLIVKQEFKLDKDVIRNRWVVTEAPMAFSPKCFFDWLELPLLRRESDEV